MPPSSSGGGGPLSRQSAELLRRLDATRLSASAAIGYRRLKGKVTARAAALRRPIAWTRKRVVLRDKVAFVLGVFHIIASAYWLGYSPSTFYRLYTVKALLLLTIRLVLYRKEKMHYYLLDFCYYANALMLVHVWALPEACDLQKVMFAFAMGPARVEHHPLPQLHDLPLPRQGALLPPPAAAAQCACHQMRRIVQTLAGGHVQAAAVNCVHARTARVLA